jgi:site-specific DNA-methyltransferase (adenine-specific)
METILKTEHGKLIHGDNIEVMKKIPENTVDSCISDFPYFLDFMGKSWDSSKNCYEWCKARAVELHRIMKSGGYVCIFGHCKTNHRMKCAFEDVGFNIVEEIDWVYGSGFPKNQDIGKLFDKKAGVERTEIIGRSPYEGRRPNSFGGNKNGDVCYGDYKAQPEMPIFAPVTKLAKKFNGWKTSGLKPAHESITVFQKPLEGTYIQNIEKYNCGAMNIDACRIDFSKNDDTRIGKDYSHNTKAGLEIGEHKDNASGHKQLLHNPQGRFPSNMIFDSSMGEILDSQSGILKSGNVKPEGFKGEYSANVYGKYANNIIDSKTVYADTGGASRYFLQIDADDFVPFYYCAKATKKEKGEGNTHVTVKPKALIKWLIKLVTPIDGKTIDITAGSGTHGLCAEELNKYDGYNLKWVNVEMMNTEDEPYCEISKRRIEEALSK